MHFFYFYQGTTITVEKAWKSQGPVYSVPSSQSVTFFPAQVGPYIQVEKDKGILHAKEPPAPVAPAAPVINGAENKEANGTANGTAATPGASVASQTSSAGGGSEPTTLVEAAEAKVQNVHRFGEAFLFLIFWNQKSEQNIGPFSILMDFHFYLGEMIHFDSYLSDGWNHQELLEQHFWGHFVQFLCLVGIGSHRFKEGWWGTGVFGSAAGLAALFAALG